MTHNRTILTGGLAVCLLIIAVAPLFGRRYIPTHDGEYHIIRIVEFSRMIVSGYLFPRWAPSLNSGYGIPIFEYNYPLPNYVGFILRLFTHDAVYAFQYAMGLGFIFLVFGIFFWLRPIFGIIPAIIGACIGMFVPYLFVDLYIRGSIGEIWATGFFFLLLTLIEKKKAILIPFVFSGLILSHNILALVYTPFVIIYCCLKDWKLLLQLAFGFGLSAFFWLPALMEQKYVVGLNTVNFREHFVQAYELLIPSWGSQFSGTGGVGSKISFQVGIVPILSILTGIYAYLCTSVKRQKTLFLLLGISFGLALFFMSRNSTLFWEYIPLLSNVQYPWRLMSFAIPFSAYSAAFWTYRFKKPVIGFLFVLSGFLITFKYFHPVTYEPRNEQYYTSKRNFTDGTSSMGNSFSTVWSGWKHNRPTSPLYLTNGIVTKKNLDKYLDKRFIVRMLSAGSLVASISYFPGWKITVDGNDVPIQYESDGVLHAELAQGEHHIRIFFTNTPIRTLSTYISLLCLVTLVSWGILHIYEYRH